MTPLAVTLRAAFWIGWTLGLVAGIPAGVAICLALQPSGPRAAGGGQ